jgi:hypothetical protein
MSLPAHCVLLLPYFVCGCCAVPCCCPLQGMLYDLSLAGTAGLRATQAREDQGKEQQPPAADGAAADEP